MGDAFFRGYDTPVALMKAYNLSWRELMETPFDIVEIMMRHISAEAQASKRLSKRK